MAAGDPEPPPPPSVERTATVAPPPRSLDEFKSLSAEGQSEEVFKLLSLLSPFASQVRTEEKSGCRKDSNTGIASNNTMWFIVWLTVKTLKPVKPRLIVQSMLKSQLHVFEKQK